MGDTRFKIVVPFYNVEQFIAKTIKSVRLQDYKNYQCILVNDCSTDGSLEICLSLVGDDSHFIVANNEEKKCSLENIYCAIYDHTLDDEVVVILDGDDFFYGRDVLSYLNEIYTKEKCLLTYGSYLNLSTRNRGKFAKQIPVNIIQNNTFRNFQWCASHLRTFKSSLFKKIKKKDLCDDAANFFTIGGDLVIMFPMLEMASERSRYIDKILYIWNDMSDINDHKKDHPSQLRVESIMRGREKYERFDG